MGCLEFVYRKCLAFVPICAIRGQLILFRIVEWTAYIPGIPKNR